MTETDLLKITAWLSPGFPVGAFTYSHGLEHAVAVGDVVDAASVGRWINDCIVSGGGRTDAILLAHAMRAVQRDDFTALSKLAELAEGIAPSAERLLETTAQGAAFSEVVDAAWDMGGGALPYPVAFGRAAARLSLPVNTVISLYLHAFGANLVSSAVRLVPLGQTDGQRIIADLEPVCTAVAAESAGANLEDIGGCAILADIASMRHETQSVRLFRS